MTASLWSVAICNLYLFSTSGRIRSLTPLDYEKVNSYNLTVVATDGGGLKTSTSVSISVTDVNDNAPKFDRNHPYTRSESENLDSNHVVGTVIARDADSGQFRSVIDFTGILKAKKVLDRESVARYSLVVTATDRSNPMLSSSTTVEVIILDKNDNPPKFLENPYNCTIDENSAINSRVCSVRALDDDFGENASISYELARQNSRFSVDKVKECFRLSFCHVE